MLKPRKCHTNNIQACFKSRKRHHLLTGYFRPVHQTFSQLFLLQCFCKEMKITSWPSLRWLQQQTEVKSTRNQSRNTSSLCWCITEMSTDQDWIGLDQDWSQSWRIRTGSDCNFFQNWRISTGLDWENLLFWCDYSNHIKNVSCNVILQIGG